MRGVDFGKVNDDADAASHAVVITGLSAAAQVPDASSVRVLAAPVVSHLQSWPMGRVSCALSTHALV